MIKKIVILALIFTFMIMSLLLANWQINKHSSQSNLTKEILAKNEKPLNNAALVTTDYEQYIYEEVILNGKLDYSNMQFVRNIIKYGVKGKNILIPLKMENNINVLVNTGWVPEELLDETTNMLKTKNSNKIKGRIFIPHNHQVKRLSNGDWLGVSIASIDAQLDYELAQWMLIEGAELKNTGSYERYQIMPKSFPDNEDIIIKNDVFHLGYAFTWFSFFVMGLFGMIYVYRH